MDISGKTAIVTGAASGIGLAIATAEAVLAERLAATGLDPMKVGERVVDAIRTKTFYAFVGAVPAAIIKARHRRIEEALNSPWVTHY
jgi:NAD(P)-dependent dehydrogenase (short-subunit alcohol dehydrogenase family)